MPVPPFVGQIQPFAFSFAPQGWLPCNGQLLPIQQNTALFNLIGNIYGGDGKTTFALPQLAPIGPNGPSYFIAVAGVFPEQ
jgi:microcystin-dependent protein